MDGEPNGGQEATQGAQDASQQQGQGQQETQQQGQSQVEAPDYEKQISDRDARIDFKLQLTGVRNVKKVTIMPNSIAFVQNYTSVIDKVYQRASVSGVLNSSRRMVRAGHNAKEILIPKISVTGLGDYTRNVGYKTGAITYEFETKSFNYDSNNVFSGIRCLPRGAVSCVRERAAAS